MGDGKVLDPVRRRAVRASRWNVILLAVLTGVLLFFLCLGVGPAGQAAVEAAPGAAPPLPSTCAELAPPGGEAPQRCVFGYVYVDGAPVADAPVLVRGESVSATTTTETGPGSSEPYFGLALADDPLLAAANDLRTVTAGAAGKRNRTTFVAKEGAQQVDVWLNTACGGTPIAGAIFTHTTLPRACGPYTLTGGLLVPDGYTLTIEAGTTIAVEAGLALQVDGGLVAEGLPNALITFQSAGTGAPGDWGYLFLRDDPLGTAARDRLSYVLVEHAGGAAIPDNGALRVQNTTPALSFLFVRRNASNGVYFFDGAEGEIHLSEISENEEFGIDLASDNLDAGNGYLEVHHNGKGGIRAQGSGYFLLGQAHIYENQGRGLWVQAGGLVAGAGESVIAFNQGRNGAGVFVYKATFALSDSLVQGNKTNGDGGGLACNGWNSGHCYLHNNLFLGNSAGDAGGAVFFGSLSANNEFSENVVAGNVASRGGGVFLATDTLPAVERNTFIRNRASDQGAALFVSKPRLFQNNAFLYNEGASAVYVQDQPEFFANHLFGNSPYDLENGNLAGTPNVDATGNFWRTLEPGEIEARIWHWFDDGTLGFVDYGNHAEGYIWGAPMTPPEALSMTLPAPLRAGEPPTVTLHWLPSPETDHEGYKVYYDGDGAYPHAGTGAAEGDSPIDVGDVTSYTLTGLAPGAYTFTVTAYDFDADGTADGENDQTEGDESWFARAVALPAPALSPSVAISRANVTDIALRWPQVGTTPDGTPAAVGGYAVYTATVPYAAADSPAWMVWAPEDDPVETIHAGACGNPEVNYFYQIRAIVEDPFGNRILSAPSREVAAFDFALTRGG